ncbi:MAG: rod shape-determining protein MreC [Bacteroidales bacterium]
MNTLIRVILRFHFFILFVLLEIISLSMIIFADVEKKNAFFSSANAVSGYFNNRLNSWHAYFILDKENEILRKENVKLINQVEKLRAEQNKIQRFELDTSTAYQYQYLKARVIKNSVSMDKNFITIDKGSKDGVEKDFGVISSKGIVGIVVATSRHYSLVISILHDQLGFSAKLKKNNYFGSVQWDGKNYRYVNLYEIPNHIDISLGDTVVTNNFSAIFPENIDIGVISKIGKNKSDNFYNIEIELLTDFKSLYDVYVVNNKNRRERILLENSVNDEY